MLHFPYFLHRSWLFIAGLLLAMPQASAAEAYLCEDGRLIYVTVEEFEHMKRTEPCVAAHFRRKALRANAKKEISRERTDKAVPRTRANLHDKSRVSAAAKKDAVAPQLKKRLSLKRLPTEVHTSDSLDVRGATRQAAKEQPQTTKNDYRNIPIINARPGSSSWFHHRH